MSLVAPDPAADQVKGVDESLICGPEHCFAAFDALYCALTPHSKPIAPHFPDDKYPLFVTWNTRSSRRAPRLRGCIGSFEALELHKGVAEYALVSAFQDHRYREIEESELESLECCVSLLTDFEDASSYLDWTIGVHGIRISFPNPALNPTSSNSSGAPSPLSSSAYLPRITSRQTFSATYLPDVIPEQGWNKIEAVDSAIQKAGWNGVITEDIRRSVKLRRYQSRKHTAGWDEYVAWRKDNGGTV